MKYIHNKHSLNSSFIRNFRNRATSYHARNSDYQDLPMEHAQFLVSRKYIAPEELNILKNPSTRFNFNILETLAMLKEVKINIWI